MLVYLQVLHALADLHDRASALVSDDHGLVHDKAANVALQARMGLELSAATLQKGMSTHGKRVQQQHHRGAQCSRRCHLADQRQRRQPTFWR